VIRVFEITDPFTFGPIPERNYFWKVLRDAVGF